MYGLIAALSIFGTAPICSFDGYSFSCYFYTWEMCEQFVQGTPWRCTVNPKVGEE